MKAAVISLNSVSSKMIKEALEKYFDEVELLSIKKFEVLMQANQMQILFDGQPLDEYDCLLARGSFRYAQILHAITKTLEKSTYMPMSSESFLIGHDKFLTQILFNTNNIPMPLAYQASSDQAIKTTLENISYPIVMKMPSGTHGKGVMFADSSSSAKSILDAMAALKQPFIIQEYIDTDGVDVRAIVVGDKVVAAMQRKAVSGENRANIHAGGTGESIELDEHTKEICVQACKAMKVDIGAVDVLMSPKGPLLLEINLSPGLQGITQYTGIDVADKIASYLFEQAKENKVKSTKKGTKKIFKELGLDGANEGTKHEMITNLDMRGKRILLPESVTKLGVINDRDEYTISVKKGKIIIDKFDLNNV